MDATLILMAIVAITVATALLQTIRTIRADRSTTPPGHTWDWREDALSWNRLGIH